MVLQVLRSGRARSRTTAALLASATVATWFGFSLPGAAVEAVSVQLDQAKLMKIPDQVVSLVVGNPMIADVTLQPGGTVVVTGKGYGATNFMALDKRGAVLMDRMVNVEGPDDGVGLVTVYRGINRETYSCTPTCQKRVTLGDAPDHFTAAFQQTNMLNTTNAGSERR